MIRAIQTFCWIWCSVYIGIFVFTVLSAIVIVWIIVDTIAIRIATTSILFEKNLIFINQFKFKRYNLNFYVICIVSTTLFFKKILIHLNCRIKKKIFHYHSSIDQVVSLLHSKSIHKHTWIHNIVHINSSLNHLDSCNSHSLYMNRLEINLK